MSPLRRGLLVGGGLLLALILVVVVTLAVMLRPAALKGRIEREVHEATGLNLHIEGEVQWQAWPEPRLSIGAARVEAAAPAAGAGETGAPVPGAAGAPTAPLAQWRILSAAARWSPLLHGKARLETLTVDGVALTLVRGADGAIHWPKIASQAPPGAGGKIEPGRPIAIGHLAVNDGVVRVLSAGNAATAPGATIVSLEGFTAQAGIDYDPAAGTLRLAQPAARAVAHGGTIEPDGLRIVLDAPELTLHEAPLRLEARQLHAWIGKLEALVHLDGPADLATPAASGELLIAAGSLRRFALALGAELPPTRDPAVFGPLELQAKWRADAAGYALDPLSVKLDGNSYAGSASVAAGGPSAGHPARFALKGDALDLRRYLRPKDQPGEPFTLPVEWLRAQHVEGVLELKEAHAIVGVLHGVKIRVLDQAK